MLMQAAGLVYIPVRMPCSTDGRYHNFQFWGSFGSRHQTTPKRYPERELKTQTLGVRG